jgi:hypothetical protein
MKPIVRWLLLPACLFVVADVLVAPRHRSLTAIVLYAIGAGLPGWCFVVGIFRNRTRECISKVKFHSCSLSSAASLLPSQ